ncbi:MAG: patatin-like phospholipase family protein [Anaerolineaceae bacterium]
MIRKPVLGVALGGGGVRGFAHIGVLKTLRSEGIEIDCLSGTSMGGIIAALTACGLSVEEIEDAAKRVSKLGELAKLMDARITKLDHIFKSESIQEFFIDIVGADKQFSDLKIPLALCAVDFNLAKEVALQKGALVPAINATMGLPGIVEEVTIDGCTLVDGGSLNNVPADYVRSMGAEIVIAIDVSPQIADVNYWKSQKMPGIASGYWRANAMMGSNITEAKLNKAKVDFLIRPDIGSDVATLGGFNQIGQVIAAGAKATWDIMPELKKALKERFFFSKPLIKPAEPMQL